MLWWILGILALIYAWSLYIIRPKKVMSINHLAHKLNLKHKFIWDMNLEMGVNRSKMFIDYIADRNAANLQLGAQTVFVYQTLVKNAHPNNIKYWGEKLISCGFNPYPTPRECELISVFLNDIGVTPDVMLEFSAEITRQILTKPND